MADRREDRVGAVVDRRCADAVKRALGAVVVVVARSDPRSPIPPVAAAEVNLVPPTFLNPGVDPAVE